MDYYHFFSYYWAFLGVKRRCAFAHPLFSKHISKLIFYERRFINMILQEYTNKNLAMKMLSEQFYGGNKLLKELDKIMDECVVISKEIMQSKSSLGIATPDRIEKLKKYEPKIEKILKELFNFKEVDVIIEAFGGMNAYTLTRGQLLKTIDYLKGETPKYNKEIGPYGIRFKKPTKSLEIHIGIELLGATEMTGRVAVACLLHEVGHNFYIGDGWEITFSHISIIIQFLQMLLCSHYELLRLLPKLWLASDNMKAFMLKIRNTIQDKFYTYDTLTRFINSITNSIAAMQTAILKLAAGGIIIRLMLVSKIIALPTNIIFRDSYKDEQFADNFATAYGYGAETIKLQQIFSSTNTSWAEKQLGKIKFMSLYFDTIQNINSIFQGFGDWHPGNMTRALDQVKYLEQNLKYLPKENRKEIQSELNRAKDQLKKFRKACDEDIFLAGKYFTAEISRDQYESGGELAYHLTQSRDKNGQWGSLV